MYWMKENVTYGVSRITGKIENSVSGYTQFRDFRNMF
jgi:hypothetical protein